MARTVFLRLEWTLSLALVAVALAWGWVREIPLLWQWHTTPLCLAAGAAVGALLWLSIPLLALAPEMRHAWTSVLAPLSRSLGPLDIVIVATLSAVSEELFFRGVLMPETGVVASSLLFGLLHALNRVYALWAAVVGAGLGLLALYGGTLVIPVVAHATYNVGALLLLRRWQPRSAAP